MSTCWDNENTLRFLELYQGEPTIWDPKSKYHKDKSKVNDAWFRISVQMEIAIAELKKKKESLMACFRTHLRKKKASVKSGAGAQDVYKPIWTFYEVMEAFLGGIYDCTPTISTEDNVGSLVEEDVDSVSDNLSSSACFAPTTQTSSTSVTPTPQRPSSSKRNLQSQQRYVVNPELQEAGKQMKEAFSVLSNVLSTRSNEMGYKDDECDLYGKLLAKKLRKLPDHEREDAMYEIDGILLQKSRSRSTNEWCAGPPSRPLSSSNHTTSSSPVASLYSTTSPTQEHDEATTPAYHQPISKTSIYSNEIIETEQAANQTRICSPIVSPCSLSPPIRLQDPKPRFTIIRRYPTIHESIEAHDQPASKVQILSNQIRPLGNTNRLHYDYNTALAVDVIETDDYSFE